MKESELVCLSDNEFLLRMQCVWSYCEVHMPPEIKQEDWFRDFNRSLNLLEKLVLDKEIAPDSEELLQARSRILVCYHLLTALFPVHLDSQTKQTFRKQPPNVSSK